MKNGSICSGYWKTVLRTYVKLVEFKKKTSFKIN